MKAVLFDLDNTLTHRNNSIDKFSSLFVCEFGDRLNGIQKAEIFRTIIAVDNGGYLAINSNYSSIKDAVCHSLLENVAWVKKPSFQELREYWMEHMAKCSIPMDGVPEILAALKDLSFKIGVISNGAHSSRKAVVNALRIEQLLDVLVSSGEVGVKKPDNKIFSFALDQLGIKASEAWFIGDHPINDVIGAHSSGLKPIWLKGFHDWPENHQYPEYSIYRLNELLHIVA